MARSLLAGAFLPHRPAEAWERTNPRTDQQSQGKGRGRWGGGVRGVGEFHKKPSLYDQRTRKEVLQNRQTEENLLASFSPYNPSRFP